MSPLRFNSWSDVSGYAHALDLFFLVAFAYALAYSIRRFRAGERIYLVAFVSAMLYGFVLEVHGMLTHASYTQGEFLLMWHFKQFAAFEGSTDMPFYVPLFYPVWVLTAFKLVEPLGIRGDAARAVGVGVCCLLMDLPYVLPAPFVGWWQWHPFEYYQLWLGWPLMDGIWELTWPAAFFWWLFKTMPRIDAAHDRHDRRAAWKSLLAWPLVFAIGMNLLTPLLMAPAAAPIRIFDGFRHYPIAALYVVVAATLFLFCRKQIRRDLLTARDVFLPALHVASFGAIGLSKLVQEGGFQDYLLVDAMALYAVSMIILYPRFVARRETAVVGSEALPGADEPGGLDPATLARATPTRSRA